MLRAFTDSSGIEWRVWDVLPTSATANPFIVERLPLMIGAPYASGWLCFESQTEKRRLAPIPMDWGRTDDGALRRLLGEAVAVSERRRPS